MSKEEIINIDEEETQDFKKMSWWFDLMVDKIKKNQEIEFSKFDEALLRRYIIKTKSFYENYKFNARYGINRNTFKLWSGIAGVGKYFREYIREVPLIVVLTQLVNEREGLKKFDVLTEEDSFMSFLKQDRNDALNEQNMEDFLKEENESILDEKIYKHFCHDCHLKRYGFIKYYIREVFNESDTDEICKDLQNYDDVLKVYKKLKNNKYEK